MVITQKPLWVIQDAGKGVGDVGFGEQGVAVGLMWAMRSLL